MGDGSTVGSVRVSVLTCILFTYCLSGQILKVSSLRQELWLYFDNEHQGDHRWFENSQPNLTHYSELLPLVKSLCFTGVWQLYREENYKSEYVSLGSVETASDIHVCASINGSEIKSLRRTGSSDTDDLGLDLFTENGYKGDMFSLRGEDGLLWHVNVTVKSMAVTGYDTSVLLFEGESMDGNYSCVPVPRIGYRFNWANDIESELGIPTVGSAAAGRFCPNGVPVENFEILVEELRQKYTNKDQLKM